MPIYWFINTVNFLEICQLYIGKDCSTYSVAIAAVLVIDETSLQGKCFAGYPRVDY